MEQTGRIVLISGAPGTGKTTVSALIAARSAMERSVHLHTDGLYQSLCKGAVPPHLPGSDGQNRVVTEAFLAAAERFARGGYDVIVDGVVGPWFLQPWLQAAREGYAVHYIVLRADRAQTLARAVGREKLDERTNTELVDTMWGQFRQLGRYERYALDTTGLSVEDTVRSVLARLEDGSSLLDGPGEE